MIPLDLQLVVDRNQVPVSAKPSERYKLSESQLKAAGDGDDGAHGIQGEGGMDYDILQTNTQIEEHVIDKYSHLKF